MFPPISAKFINPPVFVLFPSLSSPTLTLIHLRLMLNTYWTPVLFETRGHLTYIKTLKILQICFLIGCCLMTLSYQRWLVLSSSLMQALDWHCQSANSGRVLFSAPLSVPSQQCKTLFSWQILTPTISYVMRRAPRVLWMNWHVRFDACQSSLYLDCFWLQKVE